MTLDEIFSTPLFTDTLLVDNEKINDFCYKYVEKFPSRQTTTGYQSFNLTETDPIVDELKSEIMSRADRIAREFYNLRDDVKIFESSSWFNINYPNSVWKSLAVAHNHSLNLLTCVYYPKADTGCGNLVLSSPDITLDYAIPNQIKKMLNVNNASSFSISPQQGLLVIFPAWIYHQVELNSSDADRISVVLNVAIDYNMELLNAVR